jgi:hypothetical protein
MYPNLKIRVLEFDGPLADYCGIGAGDGITGGTV